MTRNWRNAPYLTLAEAAEVLGVSRSKAYEMAHTGDLPTYPDHLGRQRVMPADLEPLVATQQANDDPQGDLFAPEDAVVAVTAWLSSVADPDGVIRDPDAVAMIREALADG